MLGKRKAEVENAEKIDSSKGLKRLKNDEEKDGAPEEVEYLANGLPKNYNSMVRPGVPDGSDPSNPVRVYADGVFDMLHLGHCVCLEQAKKMFKHSCLMVGVATTWETERVKGKVIMSEEERCEILKHCKWVDEVVFPGPWILSIEWLQKNNVHYICHDDLPWSTFGVDIYYPFKKIGMFRATTRSLDLSTSDIVLRILRQHDYH